MSPDSVSTRDMQIVNAVASFKQLTSTQIMALCFPSHASTTPLKRSLKRLTSNQLLARVEYRIVGGSKGGAGVYAYQLGIVGHAMLTGGRYRPWRSINHHALAIADTYIALLKLQRANKISILGYSTEPDCHLTIASYSLKPDMLIELSRPGAHSTMKLWLEIDLATEGQAQIKSKLERYWRAYQDADQSELDVFPLVVFIAVDQHRDNELKWLIAQGVKDAQPLFRAMTLTEFTGQFL